LEGHLDGLQEGSVLKEGELEPPLDSAWAATRTLSIIWRMSYLVLEVAVAKAQSRGTEMADTCLHAANTNAVHNCIEPVALRCADHMSAPVP
jgi:NAD/NADP transhydrogenase beta subunit